MPSQSYGTSVLTSHSKGPVDSVRTTGYVSGLGNIKVMKISCDDLGERSEMLKFKELFESPIPIPRISECHLVELGEDQKIKTNKAVHLSKTSNTDDTHNVGEMMDVERMMRMMLPMRQMVVVHLEGKEGHN